MRKDCCVYPGSFDPVTLGHLDIIERVSGLFSNVIVAVLDNPDKKPSFSVEKRLEMLEKACAHLPNIQIDSFSGLLVDYMRKTDTRIVIRGLRAVTDFEAEFQMAQINRQICESVETMFLMTSPDYAYISSSIIKQVIQFGGSIRQFVPACILPDIEKRFL